VAGRAGAVGAVDEPVEPVLGDVLEPVAPGLVEPAGRSVWVPVDDVVFTSLEPPS
jgi:hypothetical protein